MANIILPERFKTLLENDQELDGILKITLSTFGDILEENKLYFFSEYTNHGIKHIENVLSSSDNLISDDTYTNILSHRDIGFYILSVILHDIGMHIDLEGFKCLIDGKFDDIQIKELDDCTWFKLWTDFISEAKKFSGKQLKSIFGNENAIVRVPPFSEPGEIKENDKKLIGEFIRRYHSRLAHEIACKGFPVKSNFLEFAINLDFKSRNMIGLIARSHGTGLRKCLDYIEKIHGKDNRRFPCSIHATYQMVLLRIADYIQIDNSRTSKTLLKTKTFSSPVSEMEHNAHLSIDDINYRWHDDPERIFVNASPKDSKMYLKLKKLIKDIQYEFDISWAVLGELYGKGAEKDRPKIKYRRISSNLENELFSKQQNYVTDSLGFKTNDEIIKLLVAPLYGNDPKYAVRELLQNAVDACKERESIEKKMGNTYIPIINILIEKEADGNVYFTIRDNGIGMDIDIIKNYFLSAGASYRKSQDWQKEFLDEKGKALVRRSGRFGVGILSAFLIGEEIFIETKKNNNDGYKFSANLNTEQINVLKDLMISEGTLIKIKIYDYKIKEFELKENSSNLEWCQWYSLLNPTVKYFLYEKEIIPYKSLNPDITDELPIEWNAIDSHGYNKILWTYSKKFANIGISCNGIKIPEGVRSFIDLGLISYSPQISVFDNNAILPLTLDRNSFSEKLSFNNDLLEDIYKDFIAYFLVFEENSYVLENNIFVKSSKLQHPGVFSSIYYYNQEESYGFNRYSSKYETGGVLKAFIKTILISKKGFILNYNYFIQKLGSINTLFVQYENLPNSEFELDIKDNFIFLTDNKINSIQDYISAIEGATYNKSKGSFDPVNSRCFLKSEKYKYLFKSTIKRVSSWLNSKSLVQFEKFGFTCIHLDNPKPSIITDDFLKNNSSNINFIRENEITCPFEGDIILNKLLEKYLGDDIIIPFSLEERKKKYPLAFKELERYMKKYIGK